MENKTDWIKISTAAKIRDVSRQAMYYRVMSDKIPVYILDGNKYIDKETALNIIFRGQGSKKKFKGNA